MEEVRIAGRALSEFMAKMQSYPEISSCEINTGIFQGSNRSSIQLMHNRRGAGTLTCKIDFFGRDNYERTMHQSAFEALFLGTEPVTIDICDGYWYRAILIRTGMPRTEREYITTMEYQFRVTRHRGLPITVKCEANDNKIWCESNVLKTDCTISIPCDRLQGADSILIGLNGLQWAYSGQLSGNLILDGVNRIFTIGGQNATTAISWSDFPYLMPGSNMLEFSISGIVVSVGATLTYTPTFL